MLYPEKQNETLMKIELLQTVKFPRHHYHPKFLFNMKRHISAGKDIGRNAMLLIEKSFFKYFPRGE